MKTKYTTTNWNNKILLLATYFCFIAAPLFSNVSSNSSSRLVNSSGTIFNANGVNSNVDFIHVNPAQNVMESEHLKWLVNDILKLPSEQGLSLIKTTRDKLGYTHYKYLQTNFGLPVVGAMYIVHCKEGKVVSANGNIENIGANPPAPKLSANNAYTFASNFVSKSESVSNVAASNNQDKLVWIEDDNEQYKLAYQFEIETADFINHYVVFVDAENGDIINKSDLIQYSNKPTVAKSAYYGNVTINVDSISPTYYRLLSDKQNCLLETKSYENRFFLPLSEISDTDNDWDSTTYHQYEIDAHYSLEAVYDYFYTKFGRNSIDNAGTPVTVGVHNGNWTNTATYFSNTINCGDGDRVLYHPFTSIEMIGHEFAHGIILNELSNANIYSTETRSLIEGIADCFAVAVDVFKYPNGANFLIGDKESISHRPIRSISNPEAYSLPETYRGENWNDADYTSNGTVIGYWFFLLSRGRSGINSFQEPYVVDSIGMGKASDILYRTVVNYMTNTTIFSDFSYASIQSAVDLYGACSPEVKSVIDAWKAVGVKNNFILNRKPSFIMDKNYSCNGPTTIAFTNTTINGNNYLWYFGDGDSSTVVNPTHTYSAPGNYNVTLIAYNQIDCSLNDTLIKENCISVENSGPIIASSCNGSIPTVQNVGIKNVQLNTINHSSDYGSIEGNLDLTCSEITKIVRGSTPFLTVSTYKDFEKIKAWIDYNNDGTFNPSTEQVFYKSGSSYEYRDYLLNTSTAVLNVPLRMRIAAGNYSIPTPCNFYGDQAEDYSVVFVDDSLPPSVDFVADNLKGFVNSNIKFQGFSNQNVTSWQWSFPGGNPSTSTLANPIVTYSSPGVYSVTLVATNSWGTDSITKTNYVQIGGNYNLCTSTTQSSLPYGVLYDDGGPNSFYTPNSHCGFVIDVGCNKRLKLHLEYLIIAQMFTKFKIFEGTDTTGKQICSYDMDQQKPLLYYLDNLHKVIYHNQIGTQYQRVLRLIEISKIIANMLEITDQTYLKQLIQSAKLAKADLSSQMVFEFPELQGIAGSKYARQQGMNINITKAIQRHYYPKYSNDELPEDNNNYNNNISNIVALADKIETIVAMWNINLIPNGDKDPFALRRCAIGIIRILLHFDKNLDLYELIVRVNNIVIHDIHTYNLNKTNKEVVVTKDNKEYKNHKDNNKLLFDKSNSIVDEIYNFLLQRLVNYYNTNNANNAQYISGIIRAKVKYLNHIPLLIRTLEDINHHTDFMALLTINKRIENILKNQTLQNNMDNLSIDKLVDIKYIDNWQLEEINLYNLLLNNVPLLDEMILQQNWLGYFNKLVEFHHPINEYFEHIMIMHSDVNIKNRRITLLSVLYNTLNKICILSEI